jgi:glycosyltransferase involved in cell wall biosynthesis
MSPRIEIGIFAHNEAEGVDTTLRSLLAQDIFAGAARPRLVVVANGCTDGTSAVARGVAGVEVIELALGGKSRAWNDFVHRLASPGADILIFADADILLPEPGTLRRLIEGLATSPCLHVLSSQPVKDIAHRPQPLTWTERLIAASSGGLDDWKTSICGQLYAMPAAQARRHHLPIGLPVEDGFLRAMVLTDHLTTPESLARIGGAEGAFHIYASERRLASLLRHQVRIVISSAINAAVFAALRRLPPEERAEELATSARDEGWLPAVLQAELPRWPYGFVPPHFLMKRLTRLGGPGADRSPKRIFLAVVGFFFDTIVYGSAQIKMWRGAAAGFW